MMLKNSIKENMDLLNLNLSKIDKKILDLIKDFLLVLSFAILTGISSKLKVEIGAVPITMQTLVVLLSGALLGKKRGVISQITYLFFGLIGLPWFSRGGGITYILSPTFGYILGFILAAYLTGSLFEKGWGKNIKSATLAMLIANTLIYVPALFWLARFVQFSQLLEIGLYPFILGDILKIFLAVLVLSLKSSLKH